MSPHFFNTDEEVHEAMGILAELMWKPWPASFNEPAKQAAA